MSLIYKLYRICLVMVTRMASQLMPSSNTL